MLGIETPPEQLIDPCPHLPGSFGGYEPNGTLFARIDAWKFGSDYFQGRWLFDGTAQ
jgi:hypothetical protein